MKLNKYIAHGGICSRRKAGHLIKEGHVTVNDQIIIDPSYEVEPKDYVCVDGLLIKQEKKVYLLFNKPKDCITTVSDQFGRGTVMDFIPDRLKKVRLYPVGRLDRNTTGLLLITNDGELAQQLMHPRYDISKTYHVALDKPLTKEAMTLIKNGIILRDGKVKVDDIIYLAEKTKNKICVTLHSGKYRVIRRLFEKMGYHVVSLDRVAYAHLTKKELPCGGWRFLTSVEIAELKNLRSCLK